MENRVMGRPLDWDVLRLTTDCLTWIAFYQREAILQLPCFTGIRMFVTFMLSPSLVTRCRGLLGLLNVHCVNYEGEIRLCDPHLCMRMRGLPPIETHIQNTCDAYMKDHKETLQRRVEQEREERLTNPEPELSTFDAYEAGLRMVEYELNGPETEANSFAYPTERIFGTSSPTTDMFTAMERALRLNQKEYEADVVRLATMVLSLRQSKSNGAKSEQIRRVYFSERLAAANGVKKWPNSSYFYYALIRYRYGSRHLESGLRGVQCTDCTPYLAGQICYQMALNKFTMAVTHLSIYDHRSEWWETGVQYLVQLPASISEASKQIRASSGEAKVLQLLAAAMALLTQNQKADFGKLDSSVCTLASVKNSELVF
ncbi:hypothetical protein SISSUDRAFT_813078 [Sistotremastrum suecicum HHB10207 ss-3]|uniref:Uncharacterized protein n=1 Tax=Sistotremastrum suecicum HHB10207 ss-3 TaxID=1314776 RepID=A0A166CWJ1_9AGAM|nr:hypothetical protein SISSUDRAFT_813078 [Sistotremastrum suecicum HHB10207 ss-3]